MWMTKSSCFVLNLNLLTICFFLAGTIISDIIEIKVFSRTCIACVVLRQKGIYVQEERHRPRATGDTKA
jgi:hypothetical protein